MAFAKFSFQIVLLAFHALDFSIDKESRVLTCQAGCTLASLDQELSKQDLMMPLDLGAKGRSVARYLESEQ